MKKLTKEKEEKSECCGADLFVGPVINCLHCGQCGKPAEENWEEKMIQSFNSPTPPEDTNK